MEAQSDIEEMERRLKAVKAQISALEAEAETLSQSIAEAKSPYQKGARIVVHQHHSTLRYVVESVKPFWTREGYCLLCRRILKDGSLGSRLSEIRWMDTVSFDYSG